MTRIVTRPPKSEPRADGLLPGGWWHETQEGGRVVCDLCPRACSLKPGDRGFCFVRQNVDGEMVLTTFGKSTGFCIDPIEKKPLNHFFPGTSVLSFGTAGCNLGCKFCQNWDISKSREIERLSEQATPEAIAEAARKLGCRSVAFTYNDPVIWAEYAIATARACRSAGVKAVAVTAGYICPEARGPFFEFMDAANVDLKAFSEEFYHHVTSSHLQPVLDTLAWLKKETDVWFEITNLMIPQANDSIEEVRRMSGWVLEHCGDQVPLHFTAFHPDFRMTDRPPTPRETLIQAFEVAKSEGLKHVYVGNVDDPKRQSTYCPHCGQLLIERNWYELGSYRLAGDHCGHCGGAVAGRFDDRPGTWGRKRVPVEIGAFGRDPMPQLVTLTPGRPSMKTTPDSETPAALNVEPLSLTLEQRQKVLSAASSFVAGALLGRPVELDDPTLAGAAGILVAGTYVTLKRQGHLRACCGSLGTRKTLLQTLSHAAFTTATEDHRLPPISVTELPFLDLDVNLLFGHEPVPALGRERLALVVVGRHGLRIQRGGAVGLLLPGVAVENGWDAESFLRQICRKAGLPSTAWEDDDATLFTFESLAFDGPIDAASLASEGPARLAPDPLSQIAAHARKNIVARLQGMTPDYYLFGLPDGNVTGIALTIGLPGASSPLHMIQLSLRPGVPFQATLFGLCEAAAQRIARAGPIPRSLHVGVTILNDPAMHGTLARPDLRGLDPTHRALLMIEHDKTVLVFDPSAEPDAILTTVRQEVDVLVPERAGLFGLEAQSTESRLVFHSAPRAVPAASPVRRPALAGRFYPADPGELSSLIDGLLSVTERRPEAWPAAMVPHAALRYSGGVAAAVFNRLEVPDLVLILGPKHTRNGIDWAVDPHEAWSIPGAPVPGDPELARELAASIPGLQLDAAAHQLEHAIEIELPFLARLAPRTRVVGLTIGVGNWDLCQRFADALAQVIRRLPTRPLLLISSDMNHFATDRENRLLDEIALRAMERLDPAHLLATVTEHDISMCGVLPAVIVMETLRLLGGLRTSDRVSYATSADVTGDPSRVVGYAGMLLG
jgi:AmmeMemoRadiSam system radical SAM enzyme/AmmeMemoRadiSam system protein B/AmmeMemoRadiSam system protein A